MVIASWMSYFLFIKAYFYYRGVDSYHLGNACYVEITKWVVALHTKTTTHPKRQPGTLDFKLFLHSLSENLGSNVLLI